MQVNSFDRQHCPEPRKSKERNLQERKKIYVFLPTFDSQSHDFFIFIDIFLTDIILFGKGSRHLLTEQFLGRFLNLHSFQNFY